MLKADPLQVMFRAALDDVQQCGFIQHVQQIGEGAYAAKASSHGWATIASMLAEQLPGQLQPLRRDGLCWKNGGQAMTATVLDTSKVPDVMQGRYCVKSVLGQPEGGIPWTLGGCAKLMLKWAVEPQKFRPSGGAEKLLKNDDGSDRDASYHDCTPGVYDSLRMYDCTSYYYNLMSRLPSLRLTVTPRGLLWHPLTPDETERWADVLAAITEHRVLRNSVWGVSLGSWDRRFAYTRDKKDGGIKRIRPPGSAGPFRAAALLVARSGSELCQAQSLAIGSVYSTVDSVTVRQNTDGSFPEPTLWHDLGFPAGPKHEGPGEICGLGSWKVGPKDTRPYAQGRRQPLPAPAPALPARLWHKEWLATP